VKTVGRDREWFPKWRDLLALEERSVVRLFTIEGGVGDHGGERGTCAAVRSLVCISEQCAHLDEGKMETPRCLHLDSMM